MNIALTFDDGPGAVTGRILDLLQAHNAKATFFLCGANINGNEHLVRRAHDEGHELGNHTFDHRRVTRIGTHSVTLSLERTNELIESITGTTPTLWRAPHFDVNQGTIEIAQQLGLAHVSCTIDPQDWISDAPSIVERVRMLATGLSIIDLHDGIPPNGHTGNADRAATVLALEEILDMDAAFVTVSDLYACV